MRDTSHGKLTVLRGRSLPTVTMIGPGMSDATFTFRVDDDLKKQFAIAGRERDRTGARLLRDFMRESVQQQQHAAEDDAWFGRQVQAGLDSANAGRLTPDDQGEARIAARRDATCRKSRRGRYLLDPTMPRSAAGTRAAGDRGWQVEVPVDIVRGFTLLRGAKTEPWGRWWLQCLLVVSQSVRRAGQMPNSGALQR